MYYLKTENVMVKLKKFVDIKNKISQTKTQIVIQFV